MHRASYSLDDAAPAFIVDAAAGAIVAANAAGWKVWGLPPATEPVAVDRAMPALQRLRGLAGGSAEPLVLWTARGVLRLDCRIEPLEGGATFLVRASVPTAEAVSSAQHHGHPEPALTARVAHELRTPLSAVIAYAEILKEQYFGPLANPRYQGYARDIYDSARHALGVVDSMLRSDPASPPPLAFIDLDPARVVESCLAVARPLAERAGLALEAEIAPDLPRIVADELSLKQMLLNLLANAIKFARPGDSITVVVAYDLDGALRITVSDTGPGMVVTAPRPAVKSPKAGLGLGLPLTKALAQANGAALAIDSALGQGTRVTISFAKDRVVPV